MARISKQERLKRTAYHEAGHAIACLSVGRAFGKATIVPEGDKLGYVSNPANYKFLDPTITSYSWDPKDLRKIREQIVVFLAGYASTEILLGRYVMRRWDSFDYQYILDLLDALYAGLGQDKEVDKEVSAYIEYMELVTKNILRKNWSLVEKVADTLINERTMSYNRIKQIAPRFIQLEDTPTKEIIRSAKIL